MSLWTPVEPEEGFTSDVIKTPDRFVGRTDLIRDCIKALNTPLGLIAVYGKRGVGKSSLMRQIQNMALGDYSLAERAGLMAEVPRRIRKYLTVYYTCDQMVDGAHGLVTRLCNDQNDEDGLLRLVPNDGKELQEFVRTKEVSGGADLKVVHWGAKGIESSKYARVVPGDPIQTFRNFVDAIVKHQVQGFMKRDALLILIDEFDVINNAEGIGSLIKSLSSDRIKFAISGIADDLSSLVQDHASVERLLEEGALHVTPMPTVEAEQILTRAEELLRGRISFDRHVIRKIATLSQGYPYLVQLIGKECVAVANQEQSDRITLELFDVVLDDIRSGRAFPTLEKSYQRAVGDSEGRQILLLLLAEQNDDKTFYGEELGRVVLRKIRATASELDVEHVDQLIPRLVDKKYGPVLRRLDDRPGIYEFVNPVFRVYVTLRHF